MFILELYFPKISFLQILHLNLAFDTKLSTGPVDKQKSSPIIQRTIFNDIHFIVLLCGFW